MYVNRLLTDYILKASRAFPVALLTGPRQSGKTTLLKKIARPGMGFASLDDLAVRELAVSDPKLFFQRFKPPLFIDEIQYAPNLLPYIKLLVDERATRLKSANGLFWLSGSQNFTLMDNVSESLAGRVAIMNLLGFSLAEFARDYEDYKFLPFFMNKAKKINRALSLPEMFKIIIRGSMPKLVIDRKIDVEQYYSSYLQTYLERDIRNQVGVRSLRTFEAFLRLLAARSSQLLNMASLASEIGVALNTVKSWISLLEKTYQIYILKPYHSNLNKREIRAPKAYFMDTGLLCYLTYWRDYRSASAGPMAGQLFETWVISELIKSYWHRGKEAPFYFYRTRDGLEIDLFCVTAKGIIASEIKLAAMAEVKSFKTLESRESCKLNIIEQWIFSSAQDMMPLNAKTTLFPASSIY